MNAQDAREAVASALTAIVPDADIDSLPEDASLRDELELDSLDFLSFVEQLSTRAQVRAAWDGPPPDPSMVSGRTVFDGTRTVARYVVHCSDGVLVLDPPAGPALPALHLPLQTDAGDHPPPPR